MTDRFERLEIELAAMKPQQVPAELADRIADDLAQLQRRSWSDRLLILTMSAGSVAAAVIVGVLVLESQSSRGGGTIAPISTAAIMHQRGGGEPLAFARADAAWP